ncbi:MAG TPA: hypothetical protein PKY59_18840 [Pyrinomonadaceae bacterium]|nr:hypothetical protein [Pyrinomonadaceae bacterium]
MLKRERVRFYMFLRVIQFITDNIADFAAGGIVQTQYAILQIVSDTIQTLSGEQVEGFGDVRFSFNSKETARENLREMLSDIARTARSMVYEFNGIDLKFRMPRGINDANLLAKARAFLTEATPLRADFVRYEMEADFISELQTLIEEFEAAMSAPGTAIDDHVEATAEIGAEVRKGMIAVRTMNGAVRNKYKNDIGKLNAWQSASHIERTEKKDKPPTT